MMTDRTEDNLVERVANRFRRGDKSARSKTAGEVRFVTDRPGDDERQIDRADDFEFKGKHLRSLGDVLFKLSCGLGHIDSAHSDFTKIKAVRISPDGKLGGQGYVKSITDMRSQLTECVETISSIVDTIDDEVRAPHWQEDQPYIDEDDREEVEETLDEAEDIRENPDEFADEEYREEVIEDEET